MDIAGVQGFPEEVRQGPAIIHNGEEPGHGQTREEPVR